MIFKASDIQSDRKETADVCVIGSGAGGAVVAKEVALAGRSVIVFEEGPYVQTHEFTQDQLTAAERYYQEGGTLGVIDRAFITIIQGKCLGGSTTVNSGICFRLPDRKRTEWIEQFGWKELADSKWDRAMETLEKDLSIQPSLPFALGKNNLLFEKGAKALGMNPKLIRRNAKGCIGCGVCHTGCPSGAKMSMEKTYIPLASEKGASVYTECRAEEILVENGIAKGIRASVLDSKTKQPIHTVEVRSKVTVLAGSAVGTPMLLKKNRLLKSKQVGENLHLHPAVGTIGIYEEPVHLWKGVPQGAEVSDFYGEGIVLETATVAPEIMALQIPFIGVPHTELMQQLPNMASWGGLVEDSSRGFVRVGPDGRPFLGYRLNEIDIARLKRIIKMTSDIHFAAGARKVLSNLPGLEVIENAKDTEKIIRHPVAGNQLVLVGNHPQGTCRMGTDPHTSVVGTTCETHEVKNLFICDGSVMPSAVSVNPQITIMGVAMQTAGHILSRFS
ncbi:MAG: GMC family oxidoreductase [Deltaproteobacteria bacterium]|nr:GMC family oxidoreductase [Deltaproteobacteria bacterium]